MKNIILGFLIAIICVFTIATTVPNSLMTIKPSQPKDVLAFYSENAYEVTSKILEYTKKGYIVKSCSFSATNNGLRGAILIMEKY